LEKSSKGDQKETKNRLTFLYNGSPSKLMLIVS
jgi:hypothetical protein